MKKIKSMFSGVTLLFCVVLIQAQDAQTVCDSVLKYGARNIVSNMTTEQQKSYVFQKACKDKYKNSDNKTRLGIEAVIESVPIGLKFGQDKSQTNIDKWCNDNQKYDDNSLIAVNYEDTVFQPAITAWSSCVAAKNEGIQVITDVNGDETGITFQIKNTTSDKDVVLQGAAIIDNSKTNSIKCTVKNNQIIEELTDTKFVPLPPNQGVNVNCQRNIVKVTRQNQEIEILPSGSITLNTKLKNFQMSFLEKSVIQLTDFRANKIEQRLDMLQKQLFGGDIANGCMQNNNIQICWGQATIETIPGAPHARNFSAKFPKPFAETPNVTHSVNNNGSGHALVVSRWNVEKDKFHGQLNNMYIAKAFGSTVTMNYWAIGKPAE